MNDFDRPTASDDDPDQFTQHEVRWSARHEALTHAIEIHSFEGADTSAEAIVRSAKVFEAYLNNG